MSLVDLCRSGGCADHHRVILASEGGGAHAADSYSRTTAIGVLIDSIPKEIEEDHKDE